LGEIGFHGTETCGTDCQAAHALGLTEGNGFIKEVLGAMEKFLHSVTGNAVYRRPKNPDEEEEDAVLLSHSVGEAREHLFRAFPPVLQTLGVVRAVEAQAEVSGHGQ
jgi:hypothetical protein